MLDLKKKVCKYECFSIKVINIQFHITLQVKGWLRVLYGTTLQIYCKNKLIATILVFKKGEVLVNKEHFFGYRKESQFDLNSHFNIKTYKKIW